MRLLVGTQAGLYLLRGDASGTRVGRARPLRARHPCGPLATTSSGAILAAFAGTFYASRDGRHWTRAGALPEGMRCSHLAAMGDALYAGTEPAALFCSRDQGHTWEEIASVRQHPTASEWWGPVRLPRTRAVLADPRDPASLYVAISVAGVFQGRPTASADVDSAWEPRNAGITPMYPPGSVHHAVHRDVRHLARLRAAGNGDGDDGSLLLAATPHGLYRSRDGQTWDDLDADWARSGICVVAVAPGGGTVFAVPARAGTRGDQPATQEPLRVYRSRDAMRTWDPLTSGLPAGPADSVSRDALMAVTPGSGGVSTLYLGTRGGGVYWSDNDGDDWAPLATGLPAIRALLPLPNPGADSAPAWPTFAWPFSRR